MAHERRSIGRLMVAALLAIALPVTAHTPAGPTPAHADDTTVDGTAGDGSDPDGTTVDDTTVDDPDAGQADACTDAPRGIFLDVPASDTHAANIDCAAWWGVARGTGDGRFAPTAEVTRGQLASFVTDAVLAAGGQLPAPTRTFRDIDGNVHARAISRLATAGLISGFTDGFFRPSQAVTRGQLASILVAALPVMRVDQGLASTTDPAVTLTDVDGTAHGTAIVRAATLGIVTGYDDSTFRPGDTVTRGQFASMLARTLALAVASGVPVRAALEAIDLDAMHDEVCRFGVADVDRADAILAGRLRLPPHPEMSLPAVPTWAEDPFLDRNWRFQYHAMRWLWSLMGAAETTGDPIYLDHAYELVRSWVQANPQEAPAGDFAWNDHSTAWRALVLGCLQLQAPPPAWLQATIAEHLVTLADPDFYVVNGNHALNQSTGLLALACLNMDLDTRDLAVERTGVLAVDAVDVQGVTDEQAVEYQDYNYERYLAALGTISACGLPRPSWAARIDLMPDVLAHLTQPDGVYVPIGDTDRRVVKASFDHPALQWFVTDGAEGEPFGETFVTYDAGFTTARSGWGEPGALDAETFLSLRHGPARQLHGHLDHGSITLYADGRGLLTDPGKYAYSFTDERFHVVTAEAHNVVTVGRGCGPQPGRSSPTVRRASTAVYDRIGVRVGVCDGAGWTRMVGFVRATGDVVIVDEYRSPTTADVTQRWQLELGASAEVVDEGRVHASFDDGAQLLIEQLGEVRGTTIVAGGTNPSRGWVSPGYNRIVATPNVEVVAPRGAGGAFVTVLRPGAGPEAPPSSWEMSTSETRVRLRTADGEDVEVRLPRLTP